MTIDHILLWCGLMIPLMLSPGPSNIICAMSGLKQGVVGSVPFVIASIIVFNLIALMVGFGLGEVLAYYPNIIMMLKFLGALYIIYLSYKFIRPNKASKLISKNTYTALDGAVLQVLNPKAWTMLLTMFSVFLDQSQDHTTQVLNLVLLLFILDIFAHLAWVTGGASLAKWTKNPTIAMRVNYFFATSLCLVGLWLLSGVLFG